MIRLIILTIFVICLSFTAFAQSGGVRGKVKNDNDKGLSGVEVAAKADGKTVKSVTTDSKGEFFISGLAEGLYVLTFDKEGFSSGSYRVEIKKGEVRNLSTRNFILTVDRGTMVMIQGTVFDQDGLSLPGAKVEIARLTSGNVWEKIKAIYSSEDGEFLFRFPSGKPTSYRVTVTYKDLEPQVKEKDTDYAGIYRLAFNMPVKRQ
jgi:hypothetical protein